MRNRISNHLKPSSIYRGGVFTLILFLTLLVSCENFLNGADIKREIEEQIAYANAPKTSIKISLASADYGSVYPTEIKGAAGDSFTIEFKKKSGIEFKGWTCFDASGQDSDAVTFSDESTTEDKENRTENYTVKATIKSVQDGIEIRPKCYNPTESIKPEFTVLRIAKTKEDAENGTNLITLDEFSHYAAAASYSGTDEEKAAAKKQGIDNHHVNSFWFYFESDDTGGGVESLEVSEKLIRTTEGVAVTNSALKTVYQNNGGLNSFSGAFEYNFKNIDDGVVNLSFVVTDYSGNETSFEEAFSKKVDLVKDTLTKSTLTCVLNNDKLFFLDPNRNTVHYEFIVQPFVSGGGSEYSVYATDMDGNKCYEGWGDRYGHSTYYGHLAKLSRVEIGYSKDSMTALPESSIRYCENEKYSRPLSSDVTNDFYRVSFDCNPYQDFYICPIMVDDAGNERARFFTIYKAIDVVSCEYSSTTEQRQTRYGRDSSGTMINEYENVESPVWNVKLSSAPNALVYLFALKQDDDGNVDKNFIYAKKNDWYEGGENRLNDLIRASTTAYTSSATINDHGFLLYRYWGVIDQSARPWTYNFIDDVNWDSPENCGISSGHSGLWLLEDGIYNIYCFTFDAGYNDGTKYVTCVGKPFTVYKGVEKPHSTAPSTSDLPSDFTVSLESAGANTEKHIAHIKYSAGFTPNPNLTYVVNYTHPDIGSYSALDEISSSMDFEIPTHYCTYSFKIIAYNANGEKVQTDAKQVTVDYDNVPPLIWGGDVSSVSPNSVIISSLEITDDKSGILRKDGKIPVKYFYASQFSWNQHIDWNSEAIRTVFYSGNGNLEFPHDGQTGTTLYYQVSDNNGNTDFSNEYNLPEALFEPPSLTYSSSKIQIKWPYISSSYGESAVVQYVNNNSWTTSHTPSYGDITESDTNHIYAVSPSSSESDKFIRVQVWNNVQCFKTAYAYLPYLQNPTSNTPDLADFTVGSRGLNVFSDKPVLVHTFWASSNLGSNVEDWLYGGVETGMVEKSGSFTYTSDRLSEIPDGKYYATIIHYADGTMSMTEVKKK